MALVVDDWIWSNDGMIPTGEGEPKYWEKKQFQCNYIHNEHKKD